ncbi:MAG TPA: glycoside hydrolase family 2 TIM barrel-domain containing protein [Verrucomicrobiae bacterium]|nr:glycoside hydrolase family 2 TIM barrel-domain containing protein [Verrucomicrobiae bacterium]
MTSHSRSFIKIALLAGITSFAVCSCSNSPNQARENNRQTNPPTAREATLLDADWRFHSNDIAGNDAAKPAYDDGQWRQINVPNDYVQEGTYDRHNVRNHGYLPFEPAWYRKHFTIPASDQGKILRLDFDGVFRDSRVWLNGQFLGEHPSGYTPFSYDITQIAKPGAENVIAVRVDPRQFEGWWNEGGGIYRHVRLTILPALHVAKYGTYVMSTVPGGDEGKDEAADLVIQTAVQNEQSEAANCQVLSEIIAPDGKVVASAKSDLSAPANDEGHAQQETLIKKPELWSIESPNLYQLHTTILQDGAPVDVTTTTFGIRTIRYDADKGFFLNGMHVEIQGTANHQDFAGVGIAVPDSLQARRVEQLKRMGCNAWRTAHNPPSDALLDACDHMGMMVMDENRHLGDAETPKSPSGTTCTNFSELDTMILRDRNHPSIIMWSMCNEEKLQGKPEGAQLLSMMMQEVHRFDTTRPITCAMSGGWLTNGMADVEDIVGINYSTQVYDQVHRRYPQKPLFGSEDTNEKTTRGEYADDRETGMRSAYNLSDKNWLDVVNRPFMCGSFTWTGIDYKGEPNPYGWPDVSNNTGLMDCCGFPKDKYYYFESCWSDKPMVHVVPASWNWPGKEGQNIRVLAFSNTKQVELFLNGKSLGKKEVPHDDYVQWEVPYQPGQLTAKAYSPESTVPIPQSDEEPIATDTVETTGTPATIQLSPERTTLQANAEDAVVVPVSILDAQGRVVPDSGNRVTFQLNGPGEILGVSNGDPADHDTDKSNQRNSFHGHCIVVIEAGAQPGTIQLTASSPRLNSGTMSFEVK